MSVFLQLLQEATRSTAMKSENEELKKKRFLSILRDVLDFICSFNFPPNHNVSLWNLYLFLCLHYTMGAVPPNNL